MVYNFHDVLGYLLHDTISILTYDTGILYVCQENASEWFWMARVLYMAEFCLHTFHMSVGH